MVSVIIPTYNGEKTISRAITSVLRQNEDVEILVCDDCSTDLTEKIVKWFDECQESIKFYQNDHHTGGPNVGRNLGMTKAHGEYVAFLDQDDEWMPGKLKKQLEEISNGADLVSSRSIIKLE